MKNICDYNNFLNENNNLNITKISDCKIGDECLIVDTLSIYDGQVSDLNRYIGMVGTIVLIDEDDAKIKFDIDDNLWCFDYTCLKLLGDSSCIDVNDIRLGEMVIVGKKISYYIRQGLSEINNITENLDDVYEYLYKKKGIIVDKKDIPTYYSVYLDKKGNYSYYPTMNQVRKNDVYVKVKFENYGEFWLPYLILYRATPTYKPKRIERDI